MRRKRTLL